MDIFKKQNEMANDILTNYRGKVLAIVKATRAGATTSLLKAACELGQKTVIVAPYIEIFNSTVNDVQNIVKGKKPRITRISANEDICRKVSEKVQKHPNLKSFPFHFRPSCKNCEYNNPGHCRLQNIMASDWDVLGLTYAKLKALSTSESETALDLLEKVRRLDNLILDEFVTGIVTAAPSFEIKEWHSYLENTFNYSDRMLNGSADEATFWAGVAELAIVSDVSGEQLSTGGYATFDNTIQGEIGDFFKEHFANAGIS